MNEWSESDMHNERANFDDDNNNNNIIIIIIIIIKIKIKFVENETRISQMRCQTCNG